MQNGVQGGCEGGLLAKIKLPKLRTMTVLSWLKANMKNSCLFYTLLARGPANFGAWLLQKRSLLSNLDESLHTRAMLALGG